MDKLIKQITVGRAAAAVVVVIAALLVRQLGAPGQVAKNTECLARNTAAITRNSVVIAELARNDTLIMATVRHSNCMIRMQLTDSVFLAGQVNDRCPAPGVLR